jgi:8-oxo-dGTP diphosphatase
MAVEAIHVVAAVIGDDQGRILLTQRLAGKHLAGLWEFPGGKCEPGEEPAAALRRELREEIGLQAGALQRVIAIPWTYPEKKILLDVYRVLDFSGAAHGRERQSLRWARADELSAIPMPAADRPVVTALGLPDRYVITPEPGRDTAAFLQELERVLDAGATLIQLRAKNLHNADLRELTARAHELTRTHAARLLLNGHAGIAEEFSLDGVHLSTRELRCLTARPLGHGHWVGASCHDSDELAHAARIGVDFAVLGPVLPTRSHPHATTLGWKRFAELCAGAVLPVYALGGLTACDLPQAIEAGGQGIAGISAFWPD